MPPAPAPPGPAVLWSCSRPVGLPPPPFFEPQSAKGSVQVAVRVGRPGNRYTYVSAHRCVFRGVLRAVELSTARSPFYKRGRYRSHFFWIGNTQLPGPEPRWPRCGIPPNLISPMRSTLPRHRTCTKVTGSRRPTEVLRNRVRFCCLLRSQSSSEHFRTRVPCSSFCLPVTLSGKEAPPAPRIADCADFFCPILRTGHGCCRPMLRWANADALCRIGGAETQQLRLSAIGRVQLRPGADCSQ